MSRSLPLVMLLTSMPAWSANWIAYVGAYTSPANPGIHAFRFDDSTGKFTDAGLAAETSNPSFLAVSANFRFLYAVNESSTYQGQPTGSITAYSIGANGALKLLNVVSSQGAGPCHLALDHTGNWLFVANYNSGSIATFPVHADGSLGQAAAFVQHSGSSVNPQRQTGPHAHSVNPSPDNRFLLVADLGLDQIFTYRFDSGKGSLTPSYPAFTLVAPGSGPRHLAFARDARFAYSVNELSSTVTAFRYDASSGSLFEIQTLSTLPSDFRGSNTAAEIAIHASGRFLYVSNRGDDSIAIFRIDGESGTLTSTNRVSTQGKTPRNFAIDPSNAFLLAANQDSGNIVEFRIDQRTGGLTPSAETVSLPSPASMVFVPAGQ